MGNHLHRLQHESLISRICSSPKSRVLTDLYCTFIQAFIVVKIGAITWDSLERCYVSRIDSSGASYKQECNGTTFNIQNSRPI